MACVLRGSPSLNRAVGLAFSDWCTRWSPRECRALPVISETRLPMAVAATETDAPAGATSPITAQQATTTTAPARSLPRALARTATATPTLPTATVSHVGRLSVGVIRAMISLMGMEYVAPSATHAGGPSPTPPIRAMRARSSPVQDSHGATKSSGVLVVLAAKLFGRTQVRVRERRQLRCDVLWRLVPVRVRRGGLRRPQHYVRPRQRMAGQRPVSLGARPAVARPLCPLGEAFSRVRC